MGEPVIIGCGSGKRTSPAPAADLYTGSYIRCAVRWARSIDARLFILSAKHGLIPGDRVIAPYDATWSGPSREPTIRLDALAEQIEAAGLPAQVITLAGSEYRIRLRAASRRMVEPYNPFATLAKRRYGNAMRGYQASLMNAHHGTIPTLTGATP